jgi:DNA segregation ATPase FtsK/SpoIIIE, S-DNA-T family
MVQLSISDVRRALWREMPGLTSAGEPSSPLLGQMFHELTAELLGDSKSGQWQAALDNETVADSTALDEHIYEKLLGPRLTSRQAALRESGEQVLGLWKATSEFSRWLSGLLSGALCSGRIQFDKTTRQWTGDQQLCLPEQVLIWDVCEPGWQAPVRVSGIADSLWKNPATGRWCVVEYKLGKGARELDLAQVCLYHEMLAASGLADENGAVALVAFKPEREETFFQSAELNVVKTALRQLIGSLAGVSGDAAPLAPAPQVNEEADLAGRRLVEIYAQYGMGVMLLGDPIVGPSFIRYGIMPAGRVKVSDILRLDHELQVHMNLETPPMIHTDRGRLVIDVKRQKPQPVLFSSVAGQLPKRQPLHGSAHLPLGVDLVGQLHCVDVSQHTCPHLLVAGTAGSGKSEWMRTALAALLLRNTPASLQLVLIDPKRSAFNGLEGSPYLYQGWGVLHPLDHSIAEVLDVLIDEMNSRNLLFKQQGVDDLAAYLSKTGNPLARIFLFCDEYFDLIADKKSRSEIEIRVARLGSKGRSSGIHLVIATQYPKADVVTGILKANLSGRVCLRMTDGKQSQVVLGQSGAEQLLGQGDLLFQDIGEPKRLQAAYLPEAERKTIFSAQEY